MPEMKLSYHLDGVHSAGNLLRFSSTSRIRKQEDETDALNETIPSYIFQRDICLPPCEFQRLNDISNTVFVHKRVEL